jgi:type II secretory pathway pseudopilin PulG
MKSLRGYTYIGVLLLVALLSAGLAATGQSWSQAAQRERERELQFRGQEILAAIKSYVAATPAGQAPQDPVSFDDLLLDRRSLIPRHHLRRIYIDPFTLKPDWVLVPAPAGLNGFKGVHSASERPLLRQILSESDSRNRACDQVFEIGS